MRRKIEPEIVFKLKESIPSGGLDAAAVLQYVDWLAIGFEIIDCPFPEWRFKPADFVAAFGLHLGLVVGPPLAVEPGRIPELIRLLASQTSRVQERRVRRGRLRGGIRCAVRLCVWPNLPEPCFANPRPCRYSPEISSAAVRLRLVTWCRVGRPGGWKSMACRCPT